MREVMPSFGSYDDIIELEGCVKLLGYAWIAYEIVNSLLPLHYNH